MLSEYLQRLVRNPDVSTFFGGVTLPISSPSSLTIPIAGQPLTMGTWGYSPMIECLLLHQMDSQLRSASLNARLKLIYLVGSYARHSGIEIRTAEDLDAMSGEVIALIEGRSEVAPDDVNWLESHRADVEAYRDALEAAPSDEELIFLRLALFVAIRAGWHEVDRLLTASSLDIQTLLEVMNAETAVTSSDTQEESTDEDPVKKLLGLLRTT